MFRSLKCVCILNPIEHANISYPQGPGGGTDGLNTAFEDQPHQEGEANTAALERQRFIQVYPRLHSTFDIIFTK